MLHMSAPVQLSQHLQAVDVRIAASPCAQYAAACASTLC